MMKCPKCQFEQPPDTYCANCGINMETYRPEPKPFLKSVLTNGLFQLLIVIAVIVGVVLYDRAKDKDTNLTPTAAPLVSHSSAPSEPEPMDDTAAAPIAVSAPAPTVEEPIEAATTEAPAPEVRANKKAALPGRLPKYTIQVTFYQATKNALAELQKEMQSGSFSGEASGGIISKKKMDQLKFNRDLKSLSSNRFKDVDNQHPVTVFKGQRALGKNVGLFFQITPLRREPANLLLEIKSWGNLKTSGAEENLFLSEMSLNAQSGAFISGFLPKDKTFTDEEKAVLESDRTLKIYNNEDFWDGSLDLIMVIELTDPAA